MTNLKETGPIEFRKGIAITKKVSTTMISWGEMIISRGFGNSEVTFLTFRIDKWIELILKLQKSQKWVLSVNG